MYIKLSASEDHERAIVRRSAIKSTDTPREKKSKGFQIDCSRILKPFPGSAGSRVRNPEDSKVDPSPEVGGNLR